MPNSPTLLAACLIAALLMLSACTRVVTVRAGDADIPAGSMAESGQSDAWWSIVFRMRWDPQEEPDWYLDTLLADQVCGPALTPLDGQIRLWRFHRRAADDRAGHQFNLLVYTDQVTAEAIFARIRASRVLQWLESGGHIEALSMSPIERPELPSVARTSDAAWPVEIQASWPWFIMGVSQTWLSLIHQVSEEQPLEDDSPDGLLAYYRTVNEQVTALWRDYGQHAYLHHLNALFGYEPLVIRETNLKRF